MKRRRMPALPDTGRRYVENTRHARLAGPGLERFSRPRRAGPRVALAVVALAALLAAMWAALAR